MAANGQTYIIFEIGWVFLKWIALACHDVIDFKIAIREGLYCSLGISKFILLVSIHRTINFLVKEQCFCKAYSKSAIFEFII